MAWEESIRKMHGVLHEVDGEKAILRHDSRHVTVSDLADQYYCEMKVEQRYIQGEVEKEEMEIGSMLHEELSHLERVKMDTVINDVKERRFTFVSLPLLGRFNEVFVLGKPDVVVFWESRPLYVIELKTTRGKPSIWPTNWLQAQLYAFLLDEMGFDCSDLNVVVASISQHAETDRGMFYNELLVAIKGGRIDSFVKKRRCKIRMEPYHKDFVKDKVGWALDYWLGKREPIPTKKPGKCITCEYSESCPKSLV